MEVQKLGSNTADEIMLLNLDLFRCDEEIQTREVREGEPLALLREIYRDDPDALPPVIVYRDEEGVNWLADGFHRVRAASEVLDTAGPREIRAEVHQGTKRDAILYAAGANKHGQSLSSAEKRRVVERLLTDLQWRLWSDRQIARHTGTSHVFVGDVRKALELEASLSGNDFQIAPTTRTVQRGNTTYPMHTANIGHAANAQSTPSLVDVEEPAAGGAGMEVVVTKGLDRLKNAWRVASPSARRSFREWVVTQPLEDLAVGVSSEKTKGYSALIAQACLSTALAEATPPEGFIYDQDFLSPAEQDALLHDVQALTYVHAEFRGKKMKRLWAQFGYTYDAVRHTLEPAPPIPPFLQAVIDKARPYYPAGIEFAQCIATLYPVDSGIGYHADAKPFGDCILGVSLASEARLQFRPKGETKATFEVTASPGSLYVMQGVARWQYEHRLNPVKIERYSLTFRTLAHA